MFLPEECSEREGIPDEIERATEHDCREAEGRIKAFTGFVECFSKHTNPPAMAVAITMRTRYRIWFSAAVACQGPPKPTQRSATSANGVIRSVPARPSNRRSCPSPLIARVPSVHAAIAIAAKYATPTA